MRNLFFLILAVVSICTQGLAEKNSEDDINALKAEITRLQAEIKMWQVVAEMTIEENTELKQKSAGPTEMDEGTNYLIQSAQERAREAEKKVLVLELEVDRLRKLREDYSDAIAEKTKLERKLNDLNERLTKELLRIATLNRDMLRLQNENGKLTDQVQQLQNRLNKALTQAGLEKRKRQELEKSSSQKKFSTNETFALKNQNKYLINRVQELEKDLASLRSNQKTPNKTNTKGPRLTGELLEKAFNLQTRDVRMSVQAVLRARGFYKSSIDGVWGKGTNSALLKFAESVDMMNASSVKVMNAAMAGMNIYYSDESRGGRAPSGNSKRGNSSGLVAIVNNPSASASQAKSICRGEAANAASSYSRSLPPTNFDADCDTWGSNNISCTGSFSRGGGFWGGAADALQEANVRNQTYRSCLARYGWAEK